MAEPDHYIFAADPASLPRGTGRTVHIQGREFALYNLDGEFFAIDNECPHCGGPLGAGVLENGEVFCPLHGWAFDLKTGACRSNPDRPVKSHPVRLRNGQVQIAIDGLKNSA